MKILIYGTPRSGTTSLMKSLGNQYFFLLEEPFTEWINKSMCEYPLTELNEHSNIVVKSLALQKPKSSKNLLEFQLDFAKEFDCVIILDRKNLKEHKESFLHLYYRLDNLHPSVHQKWTMDVIPKKYQEDFEIDNRYYDLELQKEHIKRLSEVLNIPITYYEDLYGNDRKKSFDIINSWNIPIDVNKLNKDLVPIHKLRQKKSFI